MASLCSIGSNVVMCAQGHIFTGIYSELICLRCDLNKQKSLEQKLKRDLAASLLNQIKLEKTTIENIWTQIRDLKDFEQSLIVFQDKEATKGQSRKLVLTLSIN